MERETQTIIDPSAGGLGICLKDDWDDEFTT
jgi:hypothetical protein